MISFVYREIPVASFPFVLHSEFPEPAMYGILKLDENRMIRTMLWNPERLLQKKPISLFLSATNMSYL